MVTVFSLGVRHISSGGAAGECNLQDGIVASTMLVGDLADIMTVRLEHAVSCCPESSGMQTM